MAEIDEALVAKAAEVFHESGPGRTPGDGSWDRAAEIIRARTLDRTRAALATVAGPLQAQALRAAADEVYEDGGAWDVLALYVDEGGLPYAMDGIRRWIRDRADRLEQAGGA